MLILFGLSLFCITAGLLNLLFFKYSWNLFQFLILFEIIMLCLILVCLTWTKLFYEPAFFFLSLILFLISAAELGIGLLLVYFHYTANLTIFHRPKLFKY
jgi:hypothetical protein